MGHLATKREYKTLTRVTERGMEWSTGGYIISAEDLPVFDELLCRLPSHLPWNAARPGRRRPARGGWPEGEERVAALGSGHSVTWG